MGSIRMTPFTFIVMSLLIKVCTGYVCSCGERFEGDDYAIEITKHILSNPTHAADPIFTYVLSIWLTIGMIIVASIVVLIISRQSLDEKAELSPVYSNSEGDRKPISENQTYEEPMEQTSFDDIIAINNTDSDKLKALKVKAQNGDAKATKKLASLYINGYGISGYGIKKM